MKNREYKTTKEIEQSRTLWERGVRLAEKEEGFHKSILYQLHDVYIEVTWHKHFNVIQKVCTFTNPEFLDPYLHQIDISELFS